MIANSLGRCDVDVTGADSPLLFATSVVPTGAGGRRVSLAMRPTRDGSSAGTSMGHALRPAAGAGRIAIRRPGLFLELLPVKFGKLRISNLSGRSTEGPVMSAVMRILSEIEQGDPSAAEQLLPLVYEELRRLAALRIAQEKPGQTLQATALVHEAYIRLVDTDGSQHWNSRGHFFAAAAEAMRRILVDQARHKQSQRAGGDRERIDLDAVDEIVPGPQIDVLAVDEALQALMTQDPRAGELVKLRFFAGLTVAEAARVLEISVATAENDWAYAKSWLRLQLAAVEGERRQAEI
jgi:RNA polymerase sigma factor (TIGR02999 family)